VSNVTEDKHPEHGSINIEVQQESFLARRRFIYLQLPAVEEKRDKTELERRMPVRPVFLMHDARARRRGERDGRGHGPKFDGLGRRNRRA